MGIWELLGRIADVSAVPGILTGFAITIWQLVKTRNAAVAAQVAAQDARAAVGRNSAFVLIPQLQQIEVKLRSEINGYSREAASDQLMEWRRRASHLRGLLKASNMADEDLLVKFQRSMSLASQTQSDLTDESNIDLKATTKDVLNAIAAVTDDLGEMASVQGIESGGQYK